MSSTTVSTLRMAQDHGDNPKVFFRNEREREFHKNLLEKIIDLHELFDRHPAEFEAFLKALYEKELRK